MLNLFWFILSCVLFYLMFCLAYAFGRKGPEGKPLIDKKLLLFALSEFLMIYFIINIFFLIGIFS